MAPTMSSMLKENGNTSKMHKHEIASGLDLVEHIVQLYGEISKLENLRPSNLVNTLFTQLVNVCTMPICIDMNELSKDVKEIRYQLIRLCAEAECLLESHFAVVIGQLSQPLSHLRLFPYYSNYINLALLEFKTLSDNGIPLPKRLAFIGSGPMPLSSIVLATQHMPSTLFENYDIDPEANSMATKLVNGDPDLSERMSFHTSDINHVRGDKLAEYDVIILAALVGMERKQKVEILRHLAKHMNPGAALLLRSAHGARSFLYPIVEEEDLSGFNLLCVVHPTNDVINSIILARKPAS